MTVGLAARLILRRDIAARQALRFSSEVAGLAREEASGTPSTLLLLHQAQAGFLQVTAARTLVSADSVSVIVSRHLLGLYESLVLSPELAM